MKCDAGRRLVKDHRAWAEPCPLEADNTLKVIGAGHYILCPIHMVLMERELDEAEGRKGKPPV